MACVFAVWIMGVAAGLLNCFVFAAPQEARVHSFPGYHGALPSPIYTGYETVNEQDQRRLFYYFVESEANPSQDPLIVWLTGGPGCTAFSALVYEIGPFRFDLHHLSGQIPTLIRNTNSWTKVSNIIFVDSPAGTGFSYSNDLENFKPSDDSTVDDIYTFLLKWMEDFSEFGSNPLYIGGDSYAGIFVPLVANKIADENEAGKRPKMNLEGYMVGNGLTNSDYDLNSRIPSAFGMRLIPEDFYQEITKACDNNYTGSTDVGCLSLVSKYNQMLTGINTQHILEPNCSDQFLNSHSSNSMNTANAHRLLHYSYSDQPCPPVGKFELAYIWANNPNAEPVEVMGVWVRCKHYKSYNYQYSSVIEFHRKLTTKGCRALIYSGDHDLDFPALGTQRWIRSLGYATTAEWRSWFADGQVAGFTIQYEHQLTYATVKGGGHTAPTQQPRTSFVMFQRWISGKPL